MAGKTGTIGGGPRIGGPAPGARLGGGSKEAGGFGGPAAAKFSISKALESSPFRTTGINSKADRLSGKMTVLGGQPVVRRPGQAEFAGKANFGKAEPGKITPDATNKQLGRALGRRIGDFNPLASTSPDIVRREAGRFHLPSETGPVTRVSETPVVNQRVASVEVNKPKIDTVTQLHDTRDRQAEIVRSIHREYALGPQKVDSLPKAEAQRPQVVKNKPKPAAAPEVMIVGELKKIGDRAKQQAAARKPGEVLVGPMTQYKNLDKQVVSLKKEAAKKADPANDAISLLNKRNQEKAGDAPATSSQGRIPSLDRLGALIRKKIRVAEDEEEEAKKKAKTKTDANTNVVRLRPADPAKPGLEQPARNNADWVAPVIRIGTAVPAHAPEQNTAAVTVGSTVLARPATQENTQLASVTEISQAPSVRTRPEVRNQSLGETKEEAGNVLYMADRRPTQPQPPMQPDDPPEDPEPKNGRYSFAEQTFENRLEETNDGIDDQAMTSENGLVSGAQLKQYLTNGERTTSPITDVGSDMSNKLRIKETADLAPAAPEVIRAKVISINRARRPAKHGVGQPIGNDELRLILGNQPLDEKRRVA